MRLFKLLNKIFLVLVVLSIIVAGGYTYFISPDDYKFSTYEYTSSKIPSVFDHFKIAFFSDVHINSKEDVKRFETIIKELNTKTFDMVIFGGDLYEEDIISSEEVSKILKSIECQHGKFAVLGEKDKALEITELLTKGGFEVLNNQQRTIYYENKTISLLGLNHQDASTLINDTNKTLFQLAVSHMPDTFKNNEKVVDLQLSGHSNGGNIYIPFIGGMVLDENCKTYNHGIYETPNSTLYVTNGVKGTSDFPFKLFAANEIKFITLNYEQDILE